MRIIFASGNKGKIREASEILGEDYEIITPASLGINEEIEETGNTLKENSLIKAEYLYKRTGMNVFADDTGLEVDALGGAPGVHSARYATDGHDFDANIDKLLLELSKHPGEPRSARFKSVVTLRINGERHFFEGTIEGRIAESRSGVNGFGYDPVFIADAYPGRTFAEVPEEAKNAVSHRGQSLRAMAAWLKENGF